MQRWWFSVGVRIEVKRDAQPLPDRKNLLMIAHGKLCGRDALLFCIQGNGSSVHIASGYHQHVMAGHAMIAREDVGGKDRFGDLTDIGTARAYGQARTNKQTLWRG